MNSVEEKKQIAANTNELMDHLDILLKMRTKDFHLMGCRRRSNKNGSI